MTLFQSIARMSAPALAGLSALTTGAVLLLASPHAHAQGQAGFYRAELAAPAAAKRTVIRGVVFTCGGTSCRAPKANASPRNVCISLARDVGAVTAFSAGDKAFDADALAACNNRG